MVVKTDINLCHRNSDWNGIRNRNIYNKNGAIRQNDVLLYDSIVNDVNKQRKKINSMRKGNYVKNGDNQNDNNDESIIIDENTGKEFIKMDIGSKNFDVSCRFEDNFDCFKNAKCDRIAIVHCKRKSCDDLMKCEEINKYYKDGNFRQSVTPSVLHRIAKFVLKDFYFIVSGNATVIVPPYAMENIYKNNAKIELNSTLHVGKIVDKNDNEIISNEPSDINIDWFSRNIDCPSPYAYTDRIMTEELEAYDYKIKQENGQLKKVHAQRSNELADKSLSVNNIEHESDFLDRIKEAFDNSEKKNEDQILVFPYTDRKNHHMLDVVIGIKDGKPNVTIINSNSLDLDEAIKTYGLSIANTFQKAFEVCVPEKASQTSYFFYQNRTKDGKPTQVGGTCVTHGLYNAKKIIKDKNFENSGQNVHRIKILIEAEKRAIETLLRDKAIEQDKFVQSDKQKISCDSRTNSYCCNNKFRKRKKIKSNIDFDKKRRDEAIYASKNNNVNINNDNDIEYKNFNKNPKGNSWVFTKNNDRNNFINKAKRAKFNEKKYNNDKKNYTSHVYRNNDNYNNNRFAKKNTYFSLKK